MANLSISASFAFKTNWRVLSNKLDFRPFLLSAKQNNLNNSNCFSSINSFKFTPFSKSSLESKCRQFHFCAQRFRMIEGTEGVKPPIPMTEEEVYQRVLKAIKEWDRFPQDRVSKLELDAKFVEDLSFDSLDLVEIVMSLEDEFGFEISIEDSEKFKTPRDAANYVIDHEGVNEDHEF
ncbi:hypothetical protein ACQ4LE_004659 [Meloidogyne hapla]|uniref:Acyl carrier protein n=1 Tax=Meloidogyne hapla TaxID=6305 RepID=A0A1I8BQY7_MELHA